MLCKSVFHAIAEIALTLFDIIQIIAKPILHLLQRSPGEANLDIGTAPLCLLDGVFRHLSLQLRGTLCAQIWNQTRLCLPRNREAGKYDQLRLVIHHDLSFALSAKYISLLGTKEETMNSDSDVIKPHHCFCQIPNEELQPWVHKRYIEHRPTVELIHSTDDPHEKEIISIVALLDVDEKSMLEMMGDVDKPEHHIIHCRENVKHMLGLD
jgi:hypothetical protein